MGGWGSGEYFRRANPKQEVENVPCLCSETWRRHEMLKPGMKKSGVWTWDHFHEVTPVRQAIAYNVVTGEQDGVARLEYLYGEDQERVEYGIRLLTRPCRWGGHRWYFHCPLVRHDERGGPKRSTKLYRIGRYFGCRSCHRLVYRSQNDSGKAKRLGRILGIDMNFLNRRDNDCSHGRWQGCWVGSPQLS